VLFAIASNLLRDYSLQDPHDLRIRRRHSALPETPFIEAFTEATALFLRRLEAAQHTLAQRPTVGKALLLDSRFLNPGSNGLGTVQFDCALTSPPYATALPYIDTQRLSLVWLELLAPADMLPLEARLIGSREVRGERKQELLAALLENRRGLPTEQADFCLTLQAAVADQQDGFRRQAVPLLLYRYFVGMAEVLRAVRRCIKDGAPFALIVGRNHTILGGKRFEINTPHHLAALAGCCGWTHEETVPLQTYQRYGYHMSNAVHSEALVIVRAR
jgi:site-specific DNA-methyltransferase (cytosine-N4-specific)